MKAYPKPMRVHRGGQLSFGELRGLRGELRGASGSFGGKDFLKNLEENIRKIPEKYYFLLDFLIFCRNSRN